MFKLEQNNGNLIDQQTLLTNLLTITSFLFTLIYNAMQGQLHPSSLLAVTISGPSGYSYGDHDLT